MPSKEKSPEEFDLERFVDMFDEALASNDERVINALRNLMMMVILTKPEGRKDAAAGPLRQLFEDVNILSRKINFMELELNRLKVQPYQMDPTSPDPYRYPPQTWPSTTSKPYDLGTFTYTTQTTKTK
jgi:hypothetical protein